MVTTRCRVTLTRTRVSLAVVSAGELQTLFCHTGVVSGAVAVVGGDSGPSVA